MEDGSRESRQARRDVTLLHQTLIVMLIIAFALLLWHLVDIFLLAFGAIIIAVLLRGLGDLICWATRLPRGAGLVLAGLIVVGVITGGVILLGTQAIAQFSDLGTRLSDMIRRVEGEFNAQGAFQRFMSRAGEAGPFGGMLSNIAGAASTLIGALADMLLIAFGAAYLTAEPTVYRDGLLQLTPPSQRERAAETFDAAGRALKLWLAGQVIAMLVVGSLATAGLMLLGMPSALALGLIAGLTNFVPFVGPVFAAAPALLIAASVSSAMVLWVLLLYVVIQQLEGNFITPMIERRVVSIPPALTIFAIVAAGALLGPLGLIFGAPLTVVAYVAVKKLYIAETLGEPTDVPGEESN